MCRLFGFVSPQESSVAEQLGEESIANLFSLARVHGDGWGAATLTELGRPAQLHKSPLSAADDPAFHGALNEPARAAIVHLRWATEGIPVELDNTHPFSADGLLFAHNGSLSPVSHLRELLSESSNKSLGGSTDSEMYFALIRENLASACDSTTAVLATVRRLRAEFPLASLNSLLLTPAELIVSHANARSILSQEDRVTISSFNTPAEHLDDYYGIRWLARPDGTILVGSSGVSTPEWEPLPAESILTIQLADGSTRIDTL